MRIAILGAGPSGMMAAHAASQCGHYVDIFDQEPNKTRRNSGVYFLHDDCDLLLDKVTIKQTVLGIYGNISQEEIGRLYGQKVYGQSVAKVSVLDAIQNKEIIGYNAGQAIERLWDLYGGQVIQQEIPNIEFVDFLLNIYDKVISTIPAYILYPDNNYDSIQTWIRIGKSSPDEAFLFYNVNPHCRWYRCSALFGAFVQEYGCYYTPQSDETYEYKTVIKVIGDGIQSDRKNLFLVGRYGAWCKRDLTNTVYDKTLDYLLGK